MEPIRVAHIITDLQTGGEATILSWLLPRFEKEGLRNAVFALAPNVHARGERLTIPMRALRSANIPVNMIGVRRIANPAAGIRLVRSLREFDPAIVHTYLFHAGMIARPVARLATRAAVVSSKVSIDAQLSRLPRKLEAKSLLMAHRVLVNAKAIREQLLRDCPSLARSIVLLYNGVDVDLVRRAEPPGGIPNFAEVTSSEYVVVFMGRLHRAKGPDIAVRVIADLVDSGLPVRCVLVGTGPLYGELRGLVRQLNLVDRVTFVGSLTHEEAIGVLKHAHLCLVSSRWEGIPAVILEAFAAEVPVVATAVGGNPEMIVHNRNGLLCETSVRSLAEGCRRILKDATLRALLVREGLETVKRHTTTSMVEARISLYERVFRHR